MKILLTLSILLVMLSIYPCLPYTGRDGFNPMQTGSKNSPQLQLQYCLISTCRQFFYNCKTDEKCFQSILACPPRAYQSLIECYQNQVEMNKDVTEVDDLRKCITEKCEDRA